MGAPCAEAGVFGNNPVSLFDGFDTGSGREDFEAAFVAGDGGGGGSAEGGGEWREGGIRPLDLIDVGRV